ncbi:oxidoreductase family protein [Colletotrichum truncatum]|uniref:Oxidoreductase family protein n=1 Tax=Colletotrichum truncatum TaxID=5467 RepID=A0ACC3YWA8_COLTU|nr:oxidoreductase family protein [Colletotrichum truncatum]KAF6787398.1 oxidoreductase family protein [Colletotrichum truncatum]
MSDTVYKQRIRAALAEKTWFGFDLDDTLHEFRRASSAATTKTLEAVSQRHGTHVAALKEEYSSILRDKTANAFSDGKTSFEYRSDRFVSLLERFSLSYTPEFINHLLDIYENTLTESLQLKNGAMELLLQLKTMGKKVAVITEGPQDAQERTVKQLGIAEHIDVLATTNFFGVSKTEGLFAEVLKHAQIPESEMVYVGDSVYPVMAPIRVGLIGLSSSAATAWAANSHLKYLLSPRGSSKYQITALCNSSVDAAQRAIKDHNLPAETKAYGDPADLAVDPDVDLVVVSVRVDLHHKTALPSVEAGKHVYVEWPLAQDVQHASELTAAAQKAGGKTLVGIQGRTVPVFLKIRDLLREGRVGKVLSSEVKAAGGLVDREVIPTQLKYFTDKAIGGNIVTIGFGHLFDQIQYILGDVSNLKSHTQIQRPNVKIRDPQTKEITETVKSNVPDLVITTGTLPASDITAENATLLVRFRKGQPFKGEAPLVWTINGEKGEIRLTSDVSTSLQASAQVQDIRIEVHDFESDEVETVEWGWEDWEAELPPLARSIGAAYEAFAEGKEVPTFEDALKRHEQIESILSSSA